MPNSMPLKQRSISRNLTLSLLVTLIVVGSLAMYASLLVSSYRANVELETKAQESIVSLTDVLAIPLWSFNQEMIEAIGRSYIQNEFIATLRIADVDGSVYFERQKHGESSAELRTHDIFYADTRVGHIDISLTTRYYTTVNRQLFWSYSVTIASIMVALFVMTGVLLRQFLKKPFTHLHAIVTTYAKGNYAAVTPAMPYIEFQPLITVLNDMGKKISAQLRALQIKNFAVESAISAIVLADLDGNILYVNDAFLRLWKYTGKEEVLGRSIVEFAQTKESVLEVMKALHEKGWYIGEEKVLCQDGSTPDAQLSASMVTDETGTPLCMMASFIDITERKQAEEALRESEEKFRSIFVQSPIGIELYDEEGHLIDVNTICLEMFGVKDIDVVKGFKLFEDPNLPKGAKRRLLKGESVRYEMMFDFDLVKARNLYETTKSEQCVFECFITQWGTGLGNIRGFLVHVMDITERKQAEETLRESKERYRQLFELESDAIFLIDNGTGRILEANSAASALYGYSHEELLTKKNIDLSAESEDTQRVTQTTSPTSDQVVTIPLRFHCKRDGTIFPVEITGRFFIRQGRPVHVAAIRDITERKRAEEALRESAEQYRVITSTAMDGFVVSDQVGRLLDVNEAYCHMLGYSRDELLKMSISDIEAKETPEEIHKRVQRIMESGVDRFETCHRRKDGRIIDVEVSLTFMHQTGRQLTFLRDVTDRKRAEEQLKNQNLLLEQAVQEKQREMEALFDRLLRQEKLATIGQIAGSIAHELRNPLGAAKNSVFFLKRLWQKHQLDASNPKVQEHLDLIDTELDTSERVIAYLLQMTRMKTVQREYTNLRPIIENAAEHCALPTNIQLTISLPSEPFLIWADPLQMRQVLINLLTNAIQAIEGDGNITIRATRLMKDTATRIELENDGADIAPDVLSKVFEPLYTTKATGTGLGLSICKQIIENHKGTISLKSEKGQGTIVRIVLPNQETGEFTKMKSNS